MAKTTSHGAIPTANVMTLVFAICILSILSRFVDGFSIELTRIDHIESSLFPKNITLEERHERLAQISEARVLHLSSRRFPVSINSAFNTPMWKLQKSTYLTKVFIGSGQFAAFLLLDSGSDLTWVESKHCYKCFHPKTENFDELSSATFHYLPCNHPLCVPRMCQGDLCIYSKGYFDDTYTKGYVGTDTFTFTTRNGNSVAIPGVAFGCGYNSSENMFKTSDKIVGIFAFGPGNASFIRNHESITNGVFSYCLPPADAPQGFKTYLQFGNSARLVGHARTRAQTVRLMPRIHYNVELVGISVGNTQLLIEPRFINGGFIIDTGSTYSSLGHGAYLQVRGEIIKYLKQRYGWDPLLPHGEKLALCYNRPMSTNFTLPSLTFHLNGAALQVSSMHTFVQFSSGKLCLAVLRQQEGYNTLGSFQMANQRFIFDVKAREMTFLAENCLENS